MRTMRRWKKNLCRNVVEDSSVYIFSVPNYSITGTIISPGKKINASFKECVIVRGDQRWDPFPQWTMISVFHWNLIYWHEARAMDGFARIVESRSVEESTRSEEVSSPRVAISVHRRSFRPRYVRIRFPIDRFYRWVARLETAQPFLLEKQYTPLTV